jgi:hypothetical protein
MKIDMSNNQISNFSNNVPISIEQFNQSPDPRYFDLSNNQITRISDFLLEQYGACSSVSQLSTAFFIVGVANMLLTNNSLICDCESYHLVSYIDEDPNAFPLITNRSAPLTSALCSGPPSQIGQTYLFANYSSNGNCQNYTLPNITNIFCSVYVNDTIATLPTPTYWVTTATSVTTTVAGGGSGNGTGVTTTGGTGSNVSLTLT